MITFTTEPNKEIENIFNNQVYEFNKTNAITCNVVISNGIHIRDIYIEAINGNFYVDIKKAVQSLFNIDNFTDTKVPTPITWLINDASLYREYTIEFVVIDLQGNVEVATKVQKYIKGVNQILDPLQIENTTFKVLANSNYFNFYEGLPFDISIYSNAIRTITIKNVRNGITTDKQFTVGVNRLYLSNGENTLGFENLVPLVINKINQIEFYDGLTLLLTIEVFKHEECNAPYLKWFNSKGGYSYFRFSRIYQQNRSHRANQFLNNDFKNVEDTIGNFKATGKDAEESLLLSSDILNEVDIPNFIDIYTAPKVYIYATTPNQPMTSISFKEVSIVNSTFQYKNTKRDTNQYNVVVDLPNLYTQKAT